MRGVYIFACRFKCYYKYPSVLRQFPVISQAASPAKTYRIVLDIEVILNYSPERTKTSHDVCRGCTLLAHDKLLPFNTETFSYGDIRKPHVQTNLELYNIMEADVQ